MSNVIPFKKSGGTGPVGRLKVVELLDPVAPVTKVKPSQGKVTWVKQLTEQALFMHLPSVPDWSEADAMDQFLANATRVAELADLVFNMPDYQYELLIANTEVLYGDGNRLLDHADELTDAEWDLLPTRYQIAICIIAEKMGEMGAEGYPDYRSIEMTEIAVKDVEQIQKDDDEAFLSWFYDPADARAWYTDPAIEKDPALEEEEYEEFEEEVELPAYRTVFGQPLGYVLVWTATYGVLGVAAILAFRWFFT